MAAAVPRFLLPSTILCLLALLNLPSAAEAKQVVEDGASATVLLEFKRKLRDVDNHLSSWGSAGSGAGPCGWTGVSCSSSGEVTGVTLRGLNLQGELSSTICALPRLTVLRVSNNFFLSGGVPAGFAACRSLEVLDLSSNSLVGTVPPELGQLNKIRVIDLSYNSLNGTIPAGFQSLRRLEYLVLSDNELHGDIPALLGANASNLTVVNLSYNWLTGSIPPHLCEHQTLVSLSLHSNRLTGSIPPGVMVCGTLNLLLLSDNMLAESLRLDDPPRMQNLRSLLLYF